MIFNAPQLNDFVFKKRVWITLALLFWAPLIFHCSDWAGFIVDEGFTLYGAKRWVLGEIPHRDFFFLWTPGTLAWQAVGELLSIPSLWWGRGSTLLFCILILLACLRLAKDWRISPYWTALALLANIAWGFSHWNMPYASWPAVAFALWAIVWRKNIYRSGLLWALAFWCKQNVGLLGFTSFVFGEILLGNKFEFIIRIVFVWLVGFFAGALYFIFQNSWSAFFQQVFLFPLTYRQVMSLQLPWEELLGIRFFFWLLPFFVFFKFSIGITRATREGRWREYLLWLGMLGVFLQIYPRMDFQHFLFVFPILTLALAWQAHSSQFRWERISASFFFMGLIFSGFFVISQQVYAVVKPENKLWGVRSRGAVASLNQEILELQKYLKLEGWREGDPLLVLPHEETLYPILNAKNVMPHNQFLPAYVESYGEKQENILSDYQKRGGEWIILGYEPVFQAATPLISQQLPTKFRQVKKFTYYFSVWRAKN